MTSRHTTLKPILGVALAAGLGLAAGSAFATPTYPVFQVQEGSVPGTPTNLVTANKIIGGYTEIATFNPNGTFNVSLEWNAQGFNYQDTVTGSNPQATYVNGAGSNGYGLYALYQGSGTYSTNPATGVTTFNTTPGVGSLSVYIDPGSNTGFSQPSSGTGAWTLSNNSDDYLIATGTPSAGSGTLNPNLSTCNPTALNCGSFGTSATFNPNSAGNQYFVSPIPFYNFSFQAGQLNNFTPTATQTVNGSMDVTFNRVPEPGSLALIGLGLVGLGVSRRRRRKA